jgi:hypothetical protein
LDDFRTLLKLKCNLNFREKVGFYSAKNYLENYLLKLMIESIQPMIFKLKNHFDNCKNDLNNIDIELQKSLDEDTENSLDNLLKNFVELTKNSINGSVNFSSNDYGMTLEQEKKNYDQEDFNIPEINVPIRNSNFKLFGGAQLERLLYEFKICSLAQEFPQISNDDIVSLLGFDRNHSLPDFAKIINEISQKSSKNIFLPFIDILMNRSKYILKNLFAVIIKNLNINSKMNEIFEQISEKFISSIIFETKILLKKEFEIISIIDENFELNNATDYDLLSPSNEDIEKRVLRSIKTRENETKINFVSRELSDEKIKAIKLESAIIFSSIRSDFVIFIKKKYYYYFISPLFQNFENYLKNYFKNVSKEEIKSYFGNNSNTLLDEKKNLEIICEEINHQIEKFIELQEFVKNPY